MSEKAIKVLRELGINMQTTSKALTMQRSSGSNYGGVAPTKMMVLIDELKNYKLTEEEKTELLKHINNYLIALIKSSLRYMSMNGIECTYKGETYTVIGYNDANIITNIKKALANSEIIGMLSEEEQDILRKITEASPKEIGMHESHYGNNFENTHGHGIRH